MPKLLKTESLHTISDYEPTESVNITPFIKGTVISDSVKPYRPRKRLNTTQKLIVGMVTILAAIVVALILLPWVFKFLLIMGLYLFIFIVSKGSYSTPSRGGNSGGDSGIQVASNVVARKY